MITPKALWNYSRNSPALHFMVKIIEIIKNCHFPLNNKTTNTVEWGRRRNEQWAEGLLV